MNFDDIFREQIRKTYYVYVGDGIIFPENEDDHLKREREKSNFFKDLGFIASKEGIKTNPDKVNAIREYHQPKHCLMSGPSWEWQVITDASIAKFLTDILKGENAKVSAHQSKKISVKFDEKQADAFEKLKTILSLEEVMLLYPFAIRSNDGCFVYGFRGSPFTRRQTDYHDFQDIKGQTTEFCKQRMRIASYSMSPTKA